MTWHCSIVAGRSAVKIMLPMVTVFQPVEVLRMTSSRFVSTWRASGQRVGTVGHDVRPRLSMGVHQMDIILVPCKQP